MSGSRDIIRVLVADDHPVVRRGLQSCLAAQERLRIVGEAADGYEAVEKAQTLRADLVVMDAAMPRMDGLTATEMLRREAPRIKVLVLSADNNRDCIFRIIRAGAHGHISKKASTEELLHTIDCVHNGETFFSPEIDGEALLHLVQTGGKKEPLAQLTDREREVLILIADGHKNKELAKRLRVRVQTIARCRQRIMRRLDIHSVAGLTKFAIRNGLISLDWG